MHKSKVFCITTLLSIKSTFYQLRDSFFFFALKTTESNERNVHLVNSKLLHPIIYLSLVAFFHSFSAESRSESKNCFFFLCNKNFGMFFVLCRVGCVCLSVCEGKTLSGYLRIKQRQVIQVH